MLLEIKFPKTCCNLCGWFLGGFHFWDELLWHHCQRALGLSKPHIWNPTIYWPCTYNILDHCHHGSSKTNEDWTWQMKTTITSSETCGRRPPRCRGPPQICSCTLLFSFCVEKQCETAAWNMFQFLWSSLLCCHPQSKCWTGLPNEFMTTTMMIMTMKNMKISTLWVE